MLTADEARRFEKRREARLRAEFHDRKQAANCKPGLAALALPAVADDDAEFRPAPQPQPRPPTVAEIIDRVMCEFGASPDRFRGWVRDQRIVRARWIAAALCRDLTTASYPDIARAMGRPAHSTIIAMVRRLPDVFNEPIDHDAEAPTVGEMYRRCRAAVLAKREAAA